MQPKTPLRRPARRLTQAELDAFLEKAADILRGNVDHSEFRGYVFALLFFKRISDVYSEQVQKLTEELGDEALARDPRMHNFVVPSGSLWDEVARKSRNELGNALNEAMIAIERVNQPKFDGILTNKVDFNKSDELPREKLVNLINHFSSQIFNHSHVSDDVFGDAYEYLIRNFASRAGKSSGEFYTPREVAYLIAEMIEPQIDQSVCDWASGSGGLLLQCRNYVKRHGAHDPDRLALFAQESNVTTYNISRINMILHGVRRWTHAQGDSIRSPQHPLLDEHKQLMKFDRIVMNPPFSLEDWGYDDFVGGDPYGRFGFGMPPRDNGDYAWLEHVIKSLKSDGKAVIVMSQGVLFRGQPEQTEAEDGRNQRADAEYIIRRALIEDDLIESVVVLPSKLFYGNSVPACLIVLNKSKAKNRKGKILLIWGSRHFQKSNPQNLLRPSDLMRILVPWRAFGDLETAKRMVKEYEAQLISEESAEKERRLKDVEQAFEPLLQPLSEIKTELSYLVDRPYMEWLKVRDAQHPMFGPLLNSTSDSERIVRGNVAAAKKAYAARVRELTRQVKALEKVEAERDAQDEWIKEDFDREIQHIRESAADLYRICSSPEVASRYFAVVEQPEVIDNEFNLNVPRYVDTFEAEVTLPLEQARRELGRAIETSNAAIAALESLLQGLGEFHN